MIAVDDSFFTVKVTGPAGTFVVDTAQASEPSFVSVIGDAGDLARGAGGAVRRRTTSSRRNR